MAVIMISQDFGILRDKDVVGIEVKSARPYIKNKNKTKKRETNFYWFSFYFIIIYFKDRNFYQKQTL